MVSQASTPRKKADDLLLAAPGDGWVSRETVVREMMRFVMPGQAIRTVARQRKGTDENEPRRRDDIRVGSRQKANQFFSNALKYGVWERSGDLVRHRDHPAAVADRGEGTVVVVEGAVLPVAEVAEVADEPGPESGPVDAGFVLPDLAAMRQLGEFQSALRGLSKWHWAAMILAHVEVEEHGGSKTKFGLALTTAEFAELGVAGLQSKDTVRRYHQVAYAHWGRKLHPGETVEIPHKDTWPRHTATPNDVTRTRSTTKTTTAPRVPRVRIDNAANLAAALIDYHGPDLAGPFAGEVLAKVEELATRRDRKRLKVVAP